MPARYLARVSAAVLAVAFAAHAQPVEMRPFTEAATAGPANDDEKRVWAQGDEFDDILRKSSRIRTDAETTGYVQQVMDGLYPEFKGRIRVRIVRSPHLNAFALPNGSIYINEGLLARFRNEAQLATVLAHEAIHFINRHGFQSQQNVKSTAAFGTVMSMIGVPVVGLVANILALSSIYGFSRELETEADNLGYQRVVAAGYDPRETPKTFAHLIAELKASDINEPFFFSSHPKLQERFDNFERLSRDAPASAEPRPDPYLPKMSEVRVKNLEADLSMGRYKQVLLVLGDEEQRKTYPPYAHYYLGEAYRLRGEKGDDARAEQAYLKATDDAPDFPPAYRALGIHYLKQGAYENAEKHLEKYLAMAPSAAERKYAEHYLAIAREKRGKP